MAKRRRLGKKKKNEMVEEKMIMKTIWIVNLINTHAITLPSRKQEILCTTFVRHIQINQSARKDGSKMFKKANALNNPISLRSCNGPCTIDSSFVASSSGCPYGVRFTAFPSVTV